MTPNLADRLEAFIPRGDGYNSDYANTLMEAVEELRAKSAPAEPVSREAVEVVAHAVDHPEVGYKVYKDYALWMTGGEWAHNPLMTVAQNNRIVAALTAPPSPDAEMVELLRAVRAEYKAAIHWEDLRLVMKRIDAKLASLSAKQ